MASARYRAECGIPSGRTLRRPPGDSSARFLRQGPAGLVTLERARGYELTPLGSELLTSFLPLHAFAERWAER